MYQQCMVEDLPYGDWEYSPNCVDFEKPGFYYINIKYYTNMPILPTREDKLYFKEGLISGWFWHEEIILVLKYCKIEYIKILHAIISKQNGKILFDFIGILNKIKLQSGVKREVGKLLINSFYGRLGIGDNFNTIHISKTNENNKLYGVLGDFFLTKKQTKKKSKSNIAIAAVITAKARIKLYEAQQDVLKAGGRLLYSDTDSIFAAFNKNISIENTFIGNYVYFDTNKHGTEISDAVFINPKTYALLLKNNEEIVKVKGVNITNYNFFEIKKAFFNKHQVMQMESLSISKRNLTLTTLLQGKCIDLQAYNKRIWINNMTDTIPIKNDESTLL